MGEIKLNDVTRENVQAEIERRFVYQTMLVCDKDIEKQEIGKSTILESKHSKYVIIPLSENKAEVHEYTTRFDDHTRINVTSLSDDEYFVSIDEESRRRTHDSEEILVNHREEIALVKAGKRKVLSKGSYVTSENKVEQKLSYKKSGCSYNE